MPANQVRRDGAVGYGYARGSAAPVAEKTLAEAEHAAIDREVELRRLNAADMPPCVRVVSVDPSGTIVAPYAADLVRMVMHRQDGASR